MLRRGVARAWQAAHLQQQLQNGGVLPPVDDAVDALQSDLRAGCA